MSRRNRYWNQQLQDWRDLACRRRERWREWIHHTPGTRRSWARVERRGLYRIRLRESGNGGFEERLSFEALRADDRDGTLAWLWQDLDNPSE